MGQPNFRDKTALPAKAEIAELPAPGIDMPELEMA